MRKQNDSDPASVAAEKRKTERDLKARGIIAKEEPIVLKPKKEVKKTVIKRPAPKPAPKKVIKKKRR